MEHRPPYYTFYLKIIDSLLSRGVINPSMSVLVVCGGETDRELFQQLGFNNVTISNLDSRMTGKEFHPYQWSYQDAEALNFPDNAFDLVVACAGLHHCYSPHRALLECYRVARRCVAVLEARDALLSRIAARMGVVDEYEITAVVGNNCKFGGLRNSSVPNYIYRWTEREVTKAVATYAPYTRPHILWFHAFEPPFVVLKVRKTIKALILLYVAYPALWLITRVFKSQCNLLGFAVMKPDLSSDMFPWLELKEGQPTINRDWVKTRFTVTE